MCEIRLAGSEKLSTARLCAPREFATTLYERLPDSPPEVPPDSKLTADENEAEVHHVRERRSGGDEAAYLTKEVIGVISFQIVL